MNITNKFVVAAALCTFAMGAMAGDKVLLTGEASKSGKTFVSLDLDSDGTTGAFSFVVDLPSDARNFDVTKCLSDLPKSHQGGCRVVKGNRLAVIGFSMQNAVLASGVVSLGSISFDSQMKGNLKADQVQMAPAPIGARRDGADTRMRTK